MKKMKRMIAAAVAMVMVFAMSITVFAEEAKYSITIDNDAAGHTYEAYQIFTGSLSDGVLSNIAWGSGVTAEGQTALGDAAALAADLDGKTAAEAAVFADQVSAYLAAPAGRADTVKGGKYVIDGLTAGYYLVKDKDASLAGADDAYTSYILRVVENVETNPKSDVPKVEKKVQDINDSIETALTDLQDSADYDIGDTVPFTLTATLPSNVTSYKTYYVNFHDTISAGLTYNADYKVSIDGKDVTADFTVTANGTDLTFTCDDVKALGAANQSKIVVTYTATLNENAILGAQGNPNKVFLEYSNNPNNKDGGKPETGNTPEDTVIVFTYKIVVNKVDQDAKPLTGAEFTLFKKLADGTDEAVAVVKNDDGTQFSFIGIDEGDYVLRETKTPDGYNSIDDVAFTVSAEHEILSDNPTLTALSGNAAAGTIEFAASTDEGSLDTTVINQKGSTLPHTGGMGTKVLYVAGIILVLGAGVLIVARKRMDK